MSRDDLRGLARAPKDYEDFLLRVGGRNAFDEPMYRLVLAQNRMIQAGGEFWDWQEGASLTDKGGINYRRLMDMAYGGCSREELTEALAEEKDKKPVARKTEMRWVPKYTGEEGWILELWHPASRYGTREQWYAVKKDDVPIAGPYPDTGDYEAITDPPTPHLPSFDEMHNAIRFHYRGLTDREVSPKTRMLIRLAEIEQAEQKAKQAEAQFIDAKVNEINQILKSSSLEASRVRQEWAKRAGITSHIGIVQPDTWEVAR